MPGPGPNLKRATIRDVAALAGVSIGTASKALNGQGKLRTETGDRVAAAARELGFAPNVLAQGLLAARTCTVGVITTDSFGRFSIPVMLGAEDALGAGQISVFMCDTRERPRPRAPVPRHAAEPPGGRPHRGRPAHRAAAQHPQSTCWAWDAAGWGISPARSVSSRRASAHGASATRWRTRERPSPLTTCCRGSGAKPGAGKRPGS